MEHRHKEKNPVCKTNKMGHVFSFLKIFFTAFTSIKDHKRLDVTGCQAREELMQQAGERIVISSMLLVQKVVEVEAEVQTAAIDDQSTISELHVLENMSVILHERGQPWDSHEASKIYENTSDRD